MPRKGYGQLSLPDEMLQSIKVIRKKLADIEGAPKFTSNADFVKNAVNKYLNELNQLYFLGARAER